MDNIQVAVPEAGMLVGEEPEQFTIFSVTPRCALRPHAVRAMLGDVINDIQESQKLTGGYEAQLRYEPDAHLIRVWCVAGREKDILSFIVQRLAPLYLENMKSQVRSIPKDDHPTLISRAEALDLDEAALEEYDDCFYPPQFMSCPVRKRWTHHFTLPEHFLLPEVIRQIAVETGALIQTDAGGMTVFIGAPSREVGDDVYRRIDVLRDQYAIVMLNRMPQNQHVVYSQIHGDYEIDCLRPKSVHKALVDTTIIPSPLTKSQLESECSIFTLRPTEDRWNQLWQVYDYWPKPATQVTGSNKPEDFLPFLQYTLPQKTSVFKQHLIEWKNTMKSSPSMPSTLPAPCTQLPNTSQSPQSELTLPQLPSDNSLHRIEQWIGDVDGVQAVPEQPLSHREPVSQSLAEIMKTLEGLDFGNSKPSGVGSAAEPQPPVPPFEPVSDSAAKVNGQIGNGVDVLEKANTSNTTAIKSDSDPSKANGKAKAKAKDKDTAKNKDKGQTNNGTKEPTNNAKSSSNRAKKGAKGRGLPASQAPAKRPALPVQRTIIRDLETYRRSFGVHLERCLVQLLDSMTGYYGKLKVALHLGRLYVRGFDENFVIDAASLKAADRLPGCDPRMIMNVLARELPQDQVIHCQALTTRTADANYLLNLVGNDTWSGRSRSFLLDFVVTGSCNDGEPFVVSIEAPSWTFEIRPISQTATLSTIFVYCPQRMWDFGARLEGWEHWLVEPEQTAIAQQLVDSLNVRSLDNGGFEIRIHTQPSYDFAVKGVRVRQQGKSINPETSCYLCVERVSLFTFKHGQDRTVMEGVPTRTPHFEAHFGSERLNEILNENSTMGLGRVAGWKSEEMRSSGMFKSLLEPVLTVIDEMDCVGSTVRST